MLQLHQQCQSFQFNLSTILRLNIDWDAVPLNLGGAPLPSPFGLTELQNMEINHPARIEPASRVMVSMNHLYPLHPIYSLLQVTALKNALSICPCLLSRESSLMR